MSATMQLNWRGEEVKRRVRSSVKRAIDDVMADAVDYAKQNHPSWQNRTGLAEGSIAIQQPAHEVSSGVEGRWGSAGVLYFIFLEIGAHYNAAGTSQWAAEAGGYTAFRFGGGALRHAGDVVYPSLPRRIKAHL